jgi:hypothetical protein
MQTVMHIYLCFLNCKFKQLINETKIKLLCENLKSQHGNSVIKIMHTFKITFPKPLD